MYGGTEVVEKSGQCERKGARAATGLRFGFKNVDLQSGLRQNDGRGQTVGTCSDDNGSSLGCRHNEMGLMGSELCADSSRLLCGVWLAIVEIKEVPVQVLYGELP